MEPDQNQSLFPLHVQSAIQSHNGQLLRHVTLNGPFSVVLGPNGSGKTHLLRGMKASLRSVAAGKKIRFLSAGRMGLFEQFRSDYDGQRGDRPRYDQATYGSKNDTSRRHQNETLQGDFQTLSQRIDIQIKVQERLRKLFRRDLIIEWDAGNLKVLFNRSDEASAPYSSGREASGLMHLVGLLSALYDDEVGVLMIDEPEVSLHPQLQAFLLQELLDVAGQPSDGTNKKIILIATHSTEMVRLRTVDDLPNLIFCNDLREDPVQVQLDAPELRSKKIINLVASLGQLHRLSLFSTRPLLVEGASDSIICQALARRLKLFPEAAGSQLLPVEGKGNLAIVAKLLRLMGKSPTALADLDGFSDGPTLIQDYLASIPEVSTAEAAVLGASSGSDLAKSIHDKLCAVTAEKWSIIEAIAVTHPYWLIETQDENLRRRRALLGTLFCNNDADLARLENGSEFINLKARVSALFDLAEKCGLFFCRKGTIESNYFGEILAKDFDKPQAATDEASTIAETPEDAVTGRYSDVVRCITFASNVEKICEAEALQDLLLSVAAPAQGRLVADSSDGDLNALARQTIGERAGLFQVAKKKGNLEINVSSNILDVADCFPITIGRDENVVSAIGKALKLAS
jgi:energy-coupling factor transporter ATP-binding protein EcfA2